MECGPESRTVNARVRQLCWLCAQMEASEDAVGRGPLVLPAEQTNDVGPGWLASAYNWGCFGRLPQEHCQFKTSLSYISKTHLKSISQSKCWGDVGGVREVPWIDQSSKLTGATWVWALTSNFDLGHALSLHSCLRSPQRSRGGGHVS